MNFSLWTALLWRTLFEHWCVFFQMHSPDVWATVILEYPLVLELPVQPISLYCCDTLTIAVESTVKEHWILNLLLPSQQELKLCCETRVTVSHNIQITNSSVWPLAIQEFPKPDITHRGKTSLGFELHCVCLGKHPLLNWIPNASNHRVHIWRGEQPLVN